MMDNTDQSIALEFSSVEDLTKHGFKSLVESIKHSNSLPCGTNHDFYSTNQSFSKILLEDGAKIMTLMNKILQHNDISDTIHNCNNDQKVELIVDANDQMLENVANILDEYSGIKRNTQKSLMIETVTAQIPVNGSWNRTSKSKLAVSTALGMPQQDSQKDAANVVHLVGGKNIIRPQKFFKDKIDNSNMYPWQPRITEKPNSIKPLALYIEDTEFGEVYSHPYEVELEKFQPLPQTLTTCAPVLPKAVNVTPLVEVNTEEQLHDMMVDLWQQNEIAIDLEHHSYRTFMGITCLMQISTSRTDYLVDTLLLRDKLWMLNEIFTKPSVVKIFHGADSDIHWLQRDLSLYIVNMFDTHQASILLNYPRRSLAYLLTKFCNFAPNKHFQLADWRMRPLPDQLKQYAREDTHYLIYVYHMLRNELLTEGKGDNNLLKAAFERSNEICQKTYIKPICTDDSHLKFYRNCKRFFDNRQLFALKQLYNWRDSLAREEDESTGYVLPNHMLLQICGSLPREMQGIFACCNPVPPLLRANALEVHNIILRAREQPLEKAIMKEDNRAKGSTTKFNRFNVEGPLHCPHDLTRLAEFRNDLPTLFNNADYVHCASKFDNLLMQKLQPVYTVFDTSGNIGSEDVDKTHIMKSLKFLGPYERYKLVKPFVQAEEEKARKVAEEKEQPSDPSVAERIASLQKHVTTAIENSNSLAQDEQPLAKRRVDGAPAHRQTPRKKHRSLRQQGGTNKRKREDSEDSREVPKESNLTSTIPQSSSHAKPQPYRTSHEQQANPARNSKYKNNGRNKGQARPTEQPRNNQRHTRRQNDLKQGQTEEGGKAKFQPFDYASVDYKQFQGGSSVPNQGNQINSKFRGRGQGKKKFQGRNSNKSFTFSGKKGK